MPASKKIAQVEQLRESFEGSAIVVGTGLTGMNSAAMVELRRTLRDKGAEYRVVKNTLAAIAAQQAGKPMIAELLRGSTGLLLSADDPVGAVKALEEYRRASRSPLTISGAVLEGRVLSPADVGALAMLPPRPELMAQVAGRLVGLLQGLVTMLNAPSQHTVSVLNAPLQGLATVLQRHTEAEGAA